MLTPIFAVLLVGVLVWGLLQGLRQKRRSDFALGAIGGSLLLALLLRHPVFYVAAVALLALRWFLIAIERRRDARIATGVGSRLTLARSSDESSLLERESADRTADPTGTLEHYFTHAEPKLRRQALMSLVEAVGAGQPGPFARGQPEAERLGRALAAEKDGPLLLDLVARLVERQRLDLLTHNWARLPVANRRAIASAFPRTESKTAPGPSRAELIQFFRTALRDGDANVVRAALRTLREPRFAEVCAELDDPALPNRGFSELSFEVSHATIPCRGGGELQIAPGKLEARVRFAQRRLGDEDRVRVRLVFADSQGNEWQLRSHIDGSLFTTLLEDDSERAALEKAGSFALWSDAPRAWVDALRQRCSIARLRQILDSRRQIGLKIGSRTHTLLLENQAPSIDVAILGQSLIVRVSELRQRVPIGVRQTGEFDDFAPLPAFAWLAPSELLLCFREPHRHHASLTELAAGVEPALRSRSRAKRLDTKAVPQPNVVFKPA